MALRLRTIVSDQIRTGEPRQGVLSPGAEGNERLTAIAGALLFVLLAAEGVTILQVKSQFSAHAFIGVMLVGPLAAKLGSTGYRFIRYYSGAESYRRKGPPQPLLRILAPLLVASTLAVVGTGIALLVIGPSSSGSLVGLHKASFIVWFAVTTVHVLAYAWRVPGLILRDWSGVGRLRAPGFGPRLAIGGAAVVLGVAVAVVAIPSFGAWTTWFAVHHHLDG